ncbi:MAG: cyclic nucleotide-binding domain-containing protein [Acidiferrobacterales bacterium]
MTTTDVLKDLIPINTLTSDNFNELAAVTRIERVSAKSVLFKQGDTDNEAIYLLEGRLRMTSDSQSSERIVEGGTDDTRYALAQLKPRQVTGSMVSDGTVAYVDSELLDRLLTWDQVSGIEVVELDGDEDTDWMLQILRSKTFEKLPPINANEMFSHMESIEVKAGQVIIRQGDPGDYYYLIREGKCTVSQKNSDGKVAIVNQLSDGDQFGEEALISDAPRNATIMMTSDGELKRLAKKEFLKLLKAPLISWVTQKEAEPLLTAGALLLDVRTEAEYQRGAIRSSKNIPLYQIRQKVSSLNPGQKLVIYCQTGSRSSIAAFMLNQRGFDCYALEGGLSALQGAVGGGTTA